MKSIICLKNVWKEYKETKTIALKNVNLKIKRGEFVSIVGPSGSGKSTLLHIMGLLDKPTKGKVFIDGIDSDKLSDEEAAKLRNEKIGFVFQFFYLFPTLTALENVMLPMMFSKKIREKEERARKLLKSMGLEKRLRHLPNQLSGGERQRVAIARALANNPEIILADEPTGNLDTRSGSQILKILKNLHKKEGKTVVLVTHDLKASEFAERRLFIRDGKIIKEEIL